METKKGKINPVPPGFHTVTPYLVVDDAAALIEFIQNAFGGELKFRMDREDDKRVMHATVKIGDSMIMLGDTMEGMAAQTAMLYLYLDNVDEVYKKAIQAKGVSVCEPKTEFYGDRAAAVGDNWGNTWWIATHVEDVDQKELEKRGRQVQQERKEKGDQVHA